jgi:thiamine transport system permease protein
MADDVGEPRRSVGGFGRWAGVPYLVPILVFVLVFALAPVTILFAAGLERGGGLGGFASVVTQATNLATVRNSLVQGALSAALALALGYPAGIYLARYSWPGRSIVRALVLVPFLLPSMVVVLAVVDLFGTGGLLSAAWPALGWFGHGVPGIVAVNLVFNVPVVVLFTALGCESAPAALEESVASLGGSPARAYRDVWLGPSLGGATAGALLTFIFSALAFAAPIVLCGSPRCYTLEAQVYALDFTQLNATAASLLALAMVLLLVLPTVAYIVVSRRLSGFGWPAHRDRPRTREGGAVGYLLAAVSTAVWGAIAVVLGAVLYRSFVPGGRAGLGAPWTDLFGPRTADALGLSVVGVVGNTFGFALLASAMALVLALVAGVALRTRPRLGRPLAAYLFLPLLVSPVLLAFSLAEFWRPLLGGETMVWILIGVSQATLALPFVMQSLEIPLFALPRIANESARALGATGWQAFWDADMPYASGGLMVAGLFAFAIGFGEFTATNFLVTTQYTTLSVAAYELQGLRFSDASDGAAALLLLVSLAVFLAIAFVGRPRGG